MDVSLPGAIDASYEDLNRALFSVGVVFILFGFVLAIIMILKLEALPSAFEWPLPLAYILILLGAVTSLVGVVRWHAHDVKEQKFKEYVMDSLQKEQTGRVEIDGETISIEADIGMQEDDK